MESLTLSERGASSVGCSAEQRTTSASSVLLTGSVSREMETHVRASGDTRSSSCAWPSLRKENQASLNYTNLLIKLG